MKTLIHKKLNRGLLAGALIISVTAALIRAQEKSEQQSVPKIAQPNAAISSGTNADEITTPFANKTNGFENQESFDKDRQAFEDVETIRQEIVCKKDEGDAAKVAGSKSTAPGPTPCVIGKTKGGLGPVYNATSCAICHQNPITGSASQIAEIRAGHIASIAGDKEHPTISVFIEPPTGSLVHQRATNAKIQESVPREETSRTFRLTTNVLGDGFAEVLADKQITDVQKNQPDGLKGLPVVVAVTVRLEKDNTGKPTGFNHQFRIGRFGWKSQHASLLNFSADAYINEMGITSPLQDKENKSNTGVPVAELKKFDGVPFDEEYDDTQRNPKEAKTEDAFEEGKHPFGEDVEAFARFMRASNPPPRAAALPDPTPVNDGKLIFSDQKTLSINNPPGTGPIRTLACAICHQPTFQKPEKRSRIVALALPGTTPPAGSDIDILKKDGTVALPPIEDKDKIQSAVPDALGRDPSHPDKDTPENNNDPDFIFPYSDFMLHDIGTGDGIAQTQHAQIEPVGLRDGRLRERLEELFPKGALINKTPFGPARTQMTAPAAPGATPANAAFNSDLLQLSDGAVLTLVRPLLRKEQRQDLTPQQMREQEPQQRVLDQRTTNMIRTAPLWGLRTRAQLMHDGLSFTIDDAIQRHKVRAVYTRAVGGVTKTFEVNLPQNFDDLNQEEKKALRAFLKSL